MLRAAVTRKNLQMKTSQLQKFTPLEFMVIQIAYSEADSLTAASITHSHTMILEIRTQLQDIIYIELQRFKRNYSYQRHKTIRKQNGKENFKSQIHSLAVIHVLQLLWLLNEWTFWSWQSNRRNIHKINKQGQRNYLWTNRKQSTVLLLSWKDRDVRSGRLRPAGEAEFGKQSLESRQLQAQLQVTLHLDGQ